VGPETDNFRLSVSGFSGDAGDAIADPDNPNKAGNGMQFSTLDRDNDQSDHQCTYHNGWWFNSCTASILNTNNNADWNADTNETTRHVVSARMLVKFD